MDLFYELRALCDVITEREYLEDQSGRTMADSTELVNNCLKVMGRFTQAKQAYLMFLSHDRNVKQEVFYWNDTGSREGPTHDPLWLETPWWLHSLRSHRFVRVEDVRALPEDVQVDRDILLSRGIGSLLVFPVYDGKRLVAMVRLDNPARMFDYSATETDMLQIAAQLIGQVVWFANDVVEMKRDQARQTYRQLHDEVTGLPNRGLFIDRIHLGVERSNMLFGILEIDIDYYQLIHERFGHDAAEELLLNTVQKIRSCLRSADTIARLGEDKFAVLLEDIFESAYAVLVAERILANLKEPFLIANHKINISANIGITLRTPAQRNPEALLKEAEIAMTQAKRLGQGKYLVFNQSMRDHLIQRMEMENDLRGSIEHGQLLLHYQPITEMKKGCLIGFEALVRWMHPQRGMIWPMEFIALAEETGLIIPLGLWVLQEACRQMHRWHEVYPAQPLLMISVNISAKQLEQPDFADMVSQVLKESQLEPSTLRLEITESAVVESSLSMVASLDQLRSLGVQLYIDDFGTGYSSLGYLDSLPVDAIKIDRTFINNLGRARSSLGVIQAIIQMAHQLDIEVVAEGVETEDQHSELRRLDCEFMQGYFISEPLDQISVEKFILSRNDSGPGQVD